MDLISISSKVQIYEYQYYIANYNFFKPRQEFRKICEITFLFETKCSDLHNYLHHFDNITILNI